MVPRRAAQQRLAALALPLPAGGLSLRGPDRGERPALQAGAGVRAAGHRHLRRRPLLDRRGPLREGRPDRRPGADHRAQRRARGGDDRRPAHAVVPQRVVVGRGAGRTRPSRRRRRVADPRLAPGAGRLQLHVGPGPDGAPPELLFCENETNDAADLRHRRDHAVSEGRHQRPRRRRRGDGQPGRDRHEGGRLVPARRRPGATAEIRLRLRPRPPALAPARPPTRRPPRRGVRRDDGRAPRRGRRVLRRPPRPGATADEAMVMRQAFAGMLWSKQFYAYDVARWLEGDPASRRRRASG